jgi:Spy/CpxP family protein refolding chaperone
MTTPANSPAGSPARGRTVALLVLALVTLAAGLAGVAVDRLVLLPRHAEWRDPMRRPPPHDREREFRDRMARALALSDSQRVRIDSLMERQLHEVRAIREQAQPRLDSVVERTRSQIDAILTPEQREKARAMARRGDFGPGGPAGRGPGDPLGPPPPEGGREPRPPR